MRGRHLLHVAVYYTATLGSQVPVSHCQNAQAIPVTEATALSGQTIRLPQDLPSYAVLVLGFSAQSSGDSADCAKRLQEALPKQVDAKVFQVPVLEGVPKLVRGFVIRSMKKSVPDGLQSTFVPVFDHEAEWKRLTDFKSPDDTYIVLSGRQGGVLWHTRGPCSVDKIRAVTAELESESRLVHVAP